MVNVYSGHSATDPHGIIWSSGRVWQGARRFSLRFDKNVFAKTRFFYKKHIYLNRKGKRDELLFNFRALKDQGFGRSASETVVADETMHMIQHIKLAKIFSHVSGHKFKKNNFETGPLRASWFLATIFWSSSTRSR